MRDKKYVIVNAGFGIEAAILFNPIIQHVEAAFIFKNQETVVSAGFYDVNDDGKVCVWGNSTSLKLGTRGEPDARIIQKLIEQDQT